MVVIGAGPTGLGAGLRLLELGEKNFRIYDRHPYPGGLATSFRDSQGFWWDIGGHVQFSHYEYFDRLMDSLLPGEWLTHMRESWVWMMDRFIPYPFQNNIHRLPPDAMWECLSGLINVYKNPLCRKPENFYEWMLSTAGSGIVRLFMEPYNFKVWAHHPSEMNVAWVGERVAVTDLTRVVENILKKTDDISWGPNNRFRYPMYGGTGEIWRRAAERIGSGNISLNCNVMSVDTAAHILTLANGEQVGYDHLITTMPLDLFTQISDLPEASKEAARKLKHSTTYIVGVGIEGRPKKEIENKCWLYFPEDNCPFYRVTLFSKYSPRNVPDPARQFSLMAEVSASPFKHVEEGTIIEDVIAGLKNTNMMSESDRIVSTWLHKEAYGYPTPSLERDAALADLQPELMRRNILSRGRFGMWKYEVSNQDHSLMQGVEAANFIVNGTPELTAWYPNIANSPKPYDVPKKI